MISIGNSKDRKALKRLLVSHHRLDVILELLDLSHNYEADLSNKLLSGQVNIDTTADVTRSASVDLIDPHHKLKLDAEGPTDGSLHVKKMIKITYVISSTDQSEQYTVPIFCGPLTKVDRNGPVISLEAQGKEVLSFSSIWAAKTFKRTAKKTDVIIKIMMMAGEAKRKMAIPDRNAALGSHVSADRKHTFWLIVRKIANGMNMHLFYDGRGVLRLRKVPSKVVYSFNEKEALLGYPQVTYDLTEVYNCVEVLGGKPKKKKHKVHYRLVAPKKHPLSPSNLGRNGTKRYLPLLIEDDSIKSMKMARKVAKKALKNSLHEAVEVTFDSMPIPFLEELDLCSFKTSISSGRFRLQKMAIPLTADGVSSIGYLKKVVPKRSLGKSRKKRKK